MGIPDLVYSDGVYIWGCYLVLQCTNSNYFM